MLPITLQLSARPSIVVSDVLHRERRVLPPLLHTPLNVPRSSLSSLCTAARLWPSGNLWRITVGALPQSPPPRCSARWSPSATVPCAAPWTSAVDQRLKAAAPELLPRVALLQLVYVPAHIAFERPLCRLHGTRRNAVADIIAVLSFLQALLSRTSAWTSLWATLRTS